jgi:hypothetical protein
MICLKNQQIITNGILGRIRGSWLMNSSRQSTAEKYDANLEYTNQM